MQLKRGLLLNSLSQVAVRIITSFCGFVLTWLIARHSVSNLGIFRTLTVYFFLCELLPLLGMQTYLIREISRHREQTQKIVAHASVFAFTISLICAAGIVVLARLGHYGTEIRQGLYIIAAGLPATAASMIGLSVLIGLTRATTLSFIQGTETLLRTALGIALTFAGWGILPVIGVMVLTRWGIVAAYWRTIRTEFANGTWHLERAYFREFVAHVPTFAGITSLAIVLRFAAQTLLPWISDDKAAGQFAAAYLFVDMTMLVPTALITNLVPVFTKKTKEPAEALVQASSQSIKVMVAALLPVAAIISAVGPDMLHTFFAKDPAYAVSGEILRLIIWICALQAVDQVMAVAVIVRGEQKIDFQTLLVGSSSLLILLAFLIPKYAAWGAGLAVLIGSIIQLIARISLASRFLDSKEILASVWRPIMAAAAAYGVALSTGRVHWISGAICGVVAYVGILALLGGLSKNERHQVVSLLQTGNA